MVKKMLFMVWCFELNLDQKIYVMSYLLVSLVFVFVFVVGLFSVFLLFFLGDLIEFGFSKNFFVYFLVGLLLIIVIYYVVNIQSLVNQEKNFGKVVFRFVVLFLFFLVLFMGLFLYNMVVVLQGYWGKKFLFVCMLKFNIKLIKDSFKKQNYLSKKFIWTMIGEGVFVLYFVVVVGGVFYIQNIMFIVFYLMLVLGYGVIFFYLLCYLKVQQLIVDYLK